MGELSHKYADKLYSDLGFAAPELYKFHIERRMEELEAEVRSQYPDRRSDKLPEA